MGICVTGNFPYYNIDEEEERLLREFEKEKLKISSYAFNQVISSFNSKVISKPNQITNELLKPFLANFKSNYLEEVLNGPFFQKDGLLSYEKISLFLFLLAQPTLVEIKSRPEIKNYDKATFLFNYLKDKDETITPESERLNYLISLLIELSCAVLLEFYKGKEQKENIEALKMPEELISTVTESLIEILFHNDKESLEVEDFNQFFENDKYFLFPGYIRDLAYRQRDSPSVKRSKFRNNN